MGPTATYLKGYLDDKQQRQVSDTVDPSHTPVYNCLFRLCVLPPAARRRLGSPSSRCLAVGQHSAASARSHNVLAKNNLTLKVYAKGFAVDKFLGQVHERISNLYGTPDEWREFTIPYVTPPPPAQTPDARHDANPRLLPQCSESAARRSLENRPGESGTVRGQLHFRVRFRSPNGTRANTVRPNSVAAMATGMTSNSSGSLRSVPASPREDLVAAMSQMTLEEAARGLPPLYAPPPHRVGRGVPHGVGLIERRVSPCRARWWRARLAGRRGAIRRPGGSTTRTTRRAKPRGSARERDRRCPRGSRLRRRALRTSACH